MTNLIKITHIWDTQQAQVNAMAEESGMDQETIINSAINEYYHKFIEEMKKGEK